jgi:hypothetical protein
MHKRLLCRADINMLDRHAMTTFSWPLAPSDPWHPWHLNADLYTPPAQGAAPPANVSPNAVALFQNIKRLKLDVAQHVPIHGNPGGNADFERIVGPVAARAPQQGGGG